eukprot:Skav221381  [mRNA]  locus=scaffold7016:9018:26693:+ [translate_table: standard]
MSPSSKFTGRRWAVAPVMDFHCVSPVMTLIHGDVATDDPNKDTKRRCLTMLDDVRLESFLRTHGFGTDPHEGKVTGCLRKDFIYPIHVAAKLGDATAIKLLLRAHVDPDQKTGRGKTPLELAVKHDKNGSHVQATILLWQPVRLCCARELMRSTSNSFIKTKSVVKERKEIALTV